MFKYEISKSKNLLIVADYYRVSIIGTNIEKKIQVNVSIYKGGIDWVEHYMPSCNLLHRCIVSVLTLLRGLYITTDNCV